MSSKVPDEATLHKAIDDLFLKYDINADSKLESWELINLFNDTLDYLQKGRRASSAEVQLFMNYADLNRDNKIDKGELMVVFKKAISGSLPVKY